MTKMGISTLQSYRGAQIFEAIGLNRELIDALLHRTASRIEGIGLDVIAARERSCATTTPSRSSPDARRRARRRRPVPVAAPRRVPHVQPEHDRQAAARGARRQLQDVQGVLASSSNDESRQLAHAPRPARSSSAGKPMPLDEVEPASEIVKRFATGAMSLGSISREAHENLAIAMNRIGGKSNTGEGGEDPVRYKRDANGDSRRSAIKQVASRPLRRHQRLPGQRRRAADQDGAGRQARRRRPAARPQGRRVHRQDPPHDAGRRPDLAAAAPRHLLDRGSGAADPRPEERQQPGAHQREAGGRGRRRHRRRRRRQGARPTSC